MSGNKATRTWKGFARDLQKEPDETQILDSLSTAAIRKLRQTGTIVNVIDEHVVIGDDNQPHTRYRVEVYWPSQRRSYGVGERLGILEDEVRSISIQLRNE